MQQANVAVDTSTQWSSETRQPVRTPLSSQAVACSIMGEGIPPLFIERLDPKLARHDAFLAWARENRATLDALILEHGAIVLRGFPLTNAEEFDNLAGVFPVYEAGYVGGASPRSVVKGNVMEATRLAEELPITIHSEMAYLRDFPARLAFFAKTAATHGGETIIGDLRRISREIPDAVREKVQRLRVRNVRNYAAASDAMSVVADHPDQIPWNMNFGTAAKEEVDRICKTMGMDTIWNADGTLTVVNMVDGFAVHPKTGQTIYRSTIHSGGRIPYTGRHLEVERALLAKQAMPTGYTLGDGSSLTPEEKAAVKAVVDRATIKWKWQDGDVMFLDNLQVGHGRNPYKGKREVLVALLN